MSVTGANPNSRNQTGFTGGLTWVVQSSPVTSTLNYTAGLILGGMMKVENAFINLTGILQTISIMDRSAQAGAMNLYFFNSPPVGTYTDGTEFTMHATDSRNCIFSIAFADGIAYTTGGGVSVQSVTGVAQPMASVNVGPIWVLAVANGTYTYAADALTFTYGILQD